MAKQTTCDRCGEPALCEMEFKTTVTTPVKMDICEKCLADIKKVLRVYTKQEIGDLEKTIDEAISDVSQMLKKAVIEVAEASVANRS